MNDQNAANKVRYAYILLAIIVAFTILFSTPVASNAATTTLSPAAKGTVKGVTPKTLNVRSGPATTYKVVANLKEGTAVTITGYTAATGGWLKLSTPSAGYVSAQYVNVPVTGLTAAASTASVLVGSTVTVKMNIVPACATNKSITWTSSATSVATVSSSGVVTGKAVGTATITGKTASGAKTAKTTVTVKPVPVTGVSLNKAQATIYVGTTTTLTAAVAPSNAGNKAVTWASSNTTVATVSSTGVVTGKAAGTATITVKTTDGGKTATCQITVNPSIAVTGISLNQTALNVMALTPVTLAATITPTSATNKAVTWTSSDTNVATVSAAGVVTGIDNGTAVITAKTVDGGYAATCSVTVTRIPVTGITLDKTKVILAQGGTTAITPTFTPANASDKSVIWSSNHITIVTVDKKGTITAAKKSGVAIITAATNDKDGQKKATCEIDVRLTTPAISSIASGGDKKVKITWGKVTDAKTYQISRSTSQTGTYTTVKTGIANTVVSYVDNAGGYNVYWYKIKAAAANASCDSVWSTAKSFNTLLPPTGLTGSSNGSAITLSWAQTGATSYEVYRSSSSAGTYTKIGTTTSKKYSDSKAVKDKVNYYKVKALRGTVTSGFSGPESIEHTTKLSWPIGSASTISSKYGMRNGRVHDGIDIAVSNMYGKTIKAADGGIVKFAGYTKGGDNGGTDSRGKRVEILHPNGLYTVYFHNSKICVKTGDTVTRGEKIAEAGSTGRSSGPHCHFGVYRNAYNYPSPYNPLNYLK